MLARPFRLVRSKDFDYLYRRGERLASVHLLVRIGLNHQPRSRFGIVVSTKISKRATVRNRHKRQLREAIRPLLTILPTGWDVLVTVRQQFQKEGAWPELRSELTTLLVRRFSV